MKKIYKTNEIQKEALKAYHQVHRLLSAMYDATIKATGNEFPDTPELREIWKIIDNIEKYTK